MFELGLYLNFDPSHLLWLGHRPDRGARSPTSTASPTRTRRTPRPSRRERNRYGFFGRTSTRDEDPWDMGWWRYRIPGLGQVDFRRYVDTLYEGGFDGVLSVEHEDPVWGGTPEKVEQGLEIAQRNLRPLVVEPMTTATLEVRGLVKEYPGVKALKGVDFEVRAGEVHCLLGPNGAGKSTLIKCVSGVVEPTAGEILLERRAAAGRRPGGVAASAASRRSTRSSTSSRT